jgi:hypothetical protein
MNKETSVINEGIHKIVLKDGLLSFFPDIFYRELEKPRRHFVFARTKNKIQGKYLALKYEIKDGEWILKKCVKFSKKSKAIARAHDWYDKALNQK